MHIKDLWDRLDPDTRKWFIDNPGCQILPRTITAVVSKAAGEDLASGQHGETVITQEDHDFIRSKAKEASNA